MYRSFRSISLQRVTSAEKVRWNAVASEFNCLNENLKIKKRESEM